MDNLLDELFTLTTIEQEGTLSDQESDRYSELVDLLAAKDIDIPFGIEV